MGYWATLHGHGHRVFLKQFGKVSKVTPTAVKLLELEKLNVTFSFLFLWDRSTISYKIGQWSQTHEHAHINTHGPTHAHIRIHKDMYKYTQLHTSTPAAHMYIACLSHMRDQERHQEQVMEPPTVLGLRREGTVATVRGAGVVWGELSSPSGLHAGSPFLVDCWYPSWGGHGGF